LLLGYVSKKRERRERKKERKKKKKLRGGKIKFYFGRSFKKVKGGGFDRLVLKKR
jgi:hypothetical protein